MKDINCIVLIGQTLTALKGAEAGNDAVVSFETAEGKRYTMWHGQSCCENVGIHDVKGDPRSLLGSPLKVVDEVITSETWPDDVPKRRWQPDSYTWTTFTFVTERGDTVVVRWLGTSNGYYSESVSFGEEGGNS